MKRQFTSLTDGTELKKNGSGPHRYNLLLKYDRYYFMLG